MARLTQSYLRRSLVRLLRTRRLVCWRATCDFLYKQETKAICTGSVDLSARNKESSQTMIIVPLLGSLQHNETPTQPIQAILPTGCPAQMEYLTWLPRDALGTLLSLSPYLLILICALPLLVMAPHVSRFHLFEINDQPW